MKITDDMRLDFIGREVDRLHYGELPRRRCGWVLSFPDGSFIGRNGNGSSLRRSIDAAIRAKAAGEKSK